MTLKMLLGAMLGGLLASIAIYGPLYAIQIWRANKRFRRELNELEERFRREEDELRRRLERIQA